MTITLSQIGVQESIQDTSLKILADFLEMDVCVSMLRLRNKKVDAH